MTTPVPVSIVILTKNGGKRFVEALEAMKRLDTAVPYEVIVIDSGSTDGTPEIAERHRARVHRIRPEEFGHGRTRNLGASLARGEIVVYLTQDAVPASPRWLSALTAPLGDPQVAGVYGRQLPDQTSPMEHFFLETVYPAQRIVKRLDRHRPRFFDLFFSDVNSAIRKSVWGRYPFPEDVLMSEDQYWAGAALLAGYTIVYEPTAAVWHSHRYTLGRLFRRNFDSGASLVEMRQELRGLMGRFGVSYLARELAWMVRRRLWGAIPYALCYEGCRAAGFWVGTHSRRLPRVLKRRLSLQPGYWDDRIGVAGAKR